MSDYHENQAETRAYRDALLKSIHDLEIEMTTRGIEGLSLRKGLLENQSELSHQTDRLFLLNEELAKVVKSLNGKSDTKPNK